MSNSVGPPDNAGPESPDLWDRGNRYRSCKGEECAVQAEACPDIMDSRRLHSILLFLFSEMVIYCMYVLHGNKSGAWADSIASCGCIVLSMWMAKAPAVHKQSLKALAALPQQSKKGRSVLESKPHEKHLVRCTQINVLDLNMEMPRFWEGAVRFSYTLAVACDAAAPWKHTMEARRVVRSPLSGSRVIGRVACCCYC